MKNQLNLLWVLIFSILIFNGCKKDEDSTSLTGKWELNKENGANPEEKEYLNVTDSKIYFYYEYIEGDCYTKGYF